MLYKYNRLHYNYSVAIQLLDTYDIITQESTAAAKRKQPIALLHDNSTLKLQSICTSLELPQGGL